MLELKNISKTFNIGTVNEQTLFTGFSLTVEKGDFISVVGSNGSGKNDYAEHNQREHPGRRRLGDP